MEDSDYIDALAQSGLSNRTVTPSVDGWNNVQQKMKRKKRRRFFVFFLLFALLCAVGIYQGINFNTDIDAQNNSVTNKNTEQLKSGNSKNSNNNIHTNAVSDLISTSTSNSDSTSTSKNNTSQAATHKQQHQTSNNLHGDKNGVAQTQSGINSRYNDQNNNGIYNGAKNAKTATKENQFSTNKKVNFDDSDENFALNSVGLKLFPWELITPETLKKKRKKQKKATKAEKVYENLDLMIGLNGFLTPNDYKFTQSYVIEVLYTEEKKLKNDYYFNYGVSLQFRNLHFKNDSISFNRGELSLNVLSNIEKRFGNFGIEAGAYVGYEFYAPNNKIFNNIRVNFFEQKINYGLATTLNYKKIGLVFKYEFSPYINYLGKKKTGAFTIGVKYDF